MNRFMGLMPRTEVEKSQTFKVGVSQLNVTIEAGPKGFTIIYADGSTKYLDLEDTTLNNFNKGLIILKNEFNDVK